MNKQTKTLTEWQLKLLSDIFRIIVKEITCDEDKEELAPGEIGVSYTEGAFYIRNPHTGELFSPNSLSHLNQILAKYDPNTNILNADRVSGVRFYSNISQLTQLGISLSADTIIRQMEYPSILMSPIEYENYEDLGFPSNCGIMLVHKVNPEFVMTTFYDCNTYTTYNGRYNKFKNLFEGWSIGGTVDNEFVKTSGGGDTTNITSPDPLTDMMLITVRITDDLNPGAKLSYNNGEYLPIINNDGSALATSIASNNIIMLIYDDRRKGWILVKSTESSISATLAVLNKRLNETDRQLELVKKDYIERLDQLKKEFGRQIDALKLRPGNLITVASTYVAPVDSTDTINAIAQFVGTVDKLVVNFNQTILREGIDYAIEDNGIRLLTFKLNKGDTFQFIVIKQAATAQ